MLVREPAVAGLFYPQDPRALATEVQTLLTAAADAALVPAPHSTPKAVIAPHAGYRYSGSTAALAYTYLASPAVRRVVLLGPSHRVPLLGLALPGAQRLATPLGHVSLDDGGAATATTFPQVSVRPDVHATEHSLEVHLPFIQTVFEDASVVPLAVGAASPEEVAQVLDALWDGPETVVVVSSDLSHYLPYAEAQAADAATLEQILALDPHLDPYQACGARAVNGLLLLAAQRGLEARVLGACNSGDTAGDHSRVVGYAAVGFWSAP